MPFSWDQAIKGELLHLWQEWVGELQHLPTIYIPRCYTTNCSEPQKCYVMWNCIFFCDASERAYGAVMYQQLQSTDDEVHTTKVVRPTSLNKQLMG